MAVDDEQLPPGWTRVTRILEYTGPAKWIELTLNMSKVPMQGVADFEGAGFIKSGMVIWEAGDRGEQKRDFASIVVPPPPGEGN